MHKKLLLASTAVSGFAWVGYALAADIPQRVIVKAPPIVAPVPPFNWSGCHIGGQFGGAWGRKNWSDFSGSLFSQLFGGGLINVTEFFSGSVSASVSGTFSESFSQTGTATVHVVTSASFFPDSQSFTNSHAIQLTQTVTVSAATQTFTFSQTVSETFTGTVSGTIRSNRVNSFSDDTAGFLAGGQVGCDLQFAPRWVIGVEGEGEWARIKGATDLFFTNAGGDLVVDGLPVGAVIPGMFASTHTLTDWLASVTARVGYTPWDRWLFYVKGGAAWAGDKYTLRGFACTGGITAPPPACIASPFDFKGSETRFGWTAGLGIEYAFWNNWSWKLEYDFYDFGKKHVTFVDQFGNFPTGDAAINQRINVIKFGVNYNFFWGKAPVPVVAKY